MERNLTEILAINNINNVQKIIAECSNFTHTYKYKWFDNNSHNTYICCGCNKSFCCACISSGGKCIDCISKLSIEMCIICNVQIRKLICYECNRIMIFCGCRHIDDLHLKYYNGIKGKHVVCDGCYYKKQLI